MDEIPDDMQDLLDQLDTVSDVAEELEQPQTPISKEVPKKETANDDILDELEDVTPPDGSVMRPVDERKMSLNSTNVEISPSGPAMVKLTLDVDKYQKQLDVVTAEVLDAYRSDRQEAQDIINMLRGYINQQGPSKALVDGTVKAMEVKANVAQNAIRMVEASFKFMAATKSQVKVENNFAVGAEELTGILEAPQPSES